MMLALTVARRGTAAPCPSSSEEPLVTELRTAIDARRADAGAPVLRPAAPLCVEAGRLARLAAASGGALLVPESDAILERLRTAGYDGQEVAIVLAQSDMVPAALVADWRHDPRSYAQLLRAELGEVGIGVASTVGEGAGRVWAVLLARSSADFFAARTTGLRDGATVRAEMLARVNAARAEAARRPLRLGDDLGRVAQAYADDMVRRGFYGHRSPEGETAADRLRHAGRPFHAVGENLARGQFSVAEVMGEWLASPEHRRNLLAAEFGEAGFGVAWGRGPVEWQIVWVQVFADGRRTALSP